MALRALTDDERQAIHAAYDSDLTPHTTVEDAYQRIEDSIAAALEWRDRQPARKQWTRVAAGVRNWVQRDIAWLHLPYLKATAGKKANLGAGKQPARGVVNYSDWVARRQA